MTKYSNPSAKAAQQIALQIESHVIDWIAGEKNGCGLATIQEIVQTGLDKALRARDAEIEGLAAQHKKWAELAEPDPIWAESHYSDAEHFREQAKMHREFSDELLVFITKEQPKS